MKININSPKGNIFMLMQIFTDLMKKANLPHEEIMDFRRSLMLSKYDDSIERIKKLCVKLSEILEEDIEIYSSETYEMK